MGIHIIKMPDIGEGIAEVELAAWNVQPGDLVVEDQPLADVMTDKATVEIPSPVAGKVLALGGKAGDVLPVGAELIRIEVAGAGNERAAAAKAATPATATPTPAPPPAATPAAQPAAAPAPVVCKAAPAQKSALAGRQARQPGEKPLASPAVRQHAWDCGIELQLVAGSGPAGRILREDVDAHAAGNRPAPTGASARYVTQDWEEAVPVIGLRRKIAQKMQEAKRRIPHFAYVEEIDMTEIEALRLRLNEKYAATRGKLTLLPFLMRAIVLALREFPQINARYDDEADVVTRYGAVHLGIATQTDGGLMVPVVRHAEALDLWSSAAEVTRLAAATRNGKAQRDELSGSTITITSLGPLGGIVSTPIINHPEVSIVGINRMVERPMIRDGLVVARQLMNLSSSFDHRVVDGMDAAKFIQVVRGYLEFPATLFVE
ncbi:MAG: 2-oxo acid dehydrogenase subunit E2 [Gammaproteobacteria bacterium]|nr:2-oxo acid dehydrogenase subunit E2 [Rhodocyclaceae bacterium]MBU3909232.1 2-oxo acid dehydrogenase subunit E2 [Gammaproteobacteria bacterium]MBU3989660.1 2-oxo acid dehydrogenase subunit E2 [Gammaproteobacteria bacterium]MBU4005608.1 2-oxo acid dehydrogenase subunit E2 [Gammaproteobacteria bacterium]MBU4020839.1 2-oxo acid dehydrogenase subunit E2 [Gammaproteobacteria bacterium]